MTVSMLRAVSFIPVAFLAVSAPLPSAGTADGPASEWPPIPVDLVVETLRVGAGDSATLSTDEARVLPGRGAWLEKEVTLSGATPKGNEGLEKVRLRAEIRVGALHSSRLALEVRSEVRVVAASGGVSIPRAPVTRTARADLVAGTSHLFEIYESASLQAKITLNVRWFAPEEDEIGPADGRPIPLVGRLYELREGSEPTLINENLLQALVGGAASATFSRNVSLPPGTEGGRRFRQERLDLTLSPRFLVGRELSVAVRIAGSVATRSADGDSAHQLAHEGDYLLSPGVPARIDLEVAAGHESSEGWKRLRYRLEVSALF